MGTTTIATASVTAASTSTIGVFGLSPAVVGWLVVCWLALIVAGIGGSVGLAVVEDDDTIAQWLVIAALGGWLVAIVCSIVIAVTMWTAVAYDARWEDLVVPALAGTAAILAVDSIPMWVLKAVY